MQVSIYFRRILYSSSLLVFTAFHLVHSTGFDQFYLGEKLGICKVQQSAPYSFYLFLKRISEFEFVFDLFENFLSVMYLLTL